MPRYSVAYSEWVRRLAEIDTIVSMAQDVSQRPAVSRNIIRVNALCRGGIVLLCSHLEGYVEALGSLAVARIGDHNVPKVSMSPVFRYHLSRDLLDGITHAASPAVIASKVSDLINRDLHIWNTIPNFGPPLSPDALLGRFATPNHNNVRRFFSRFGYDGFNNDLAANLKSDYLTCVNTVNNLVEERNKIAHGDHLAAGTPRDLTDMCAHLRLYCRATDKVVGDWFRTIGCTIR